jgi:hypothetical protein
MQELRDFPGLESRAVGPRNHESPVNTGLFLFDLDLNLRLGDAPDRRFAEIAGSDVRSDNDDYSDEKLVRLAALHAAIDAGIAELESRPRW